MLVPLLAHVDVYIGGEDETHVLLDSCAEGVELAARVAEHGPSEVVIKRAQLGAVAVIGGAAHSQPPYPTGLTDAIGAGDAFAAGYLALRTWHGSTADALRAGVVCGAAVCAGGGDWETFPRLEELQRTLAAWPAPGG
jgi:2-dehydro-3-deoxygluconokinase